MIEEITSHEIAGDLLYGNSARDMKNRAFENAKLIDIANRLKIKVRSAEYVKSKFEHFLNDPVENSFYYPGQYTAFLATLFSLSKQYAFEVISKVNSDLDQHNMIRMINNEFLKDIR